jgi:hypothetical protein
MAKHCVHTFRRHDQQQVSVLITFTAGMGISDALFKSHFLWSDGGWGMESCLAGLWALPKRDD